MADYLIVRHAEPTLRKVILGQADPALSAAGLLQARELALNVGDVSTLFSSPLLRAKQTAEQLGKTTILVDGLKEWSYGPWDGLSWAEIESRYPTDTQLRMQNWFAYAAEGQEPWSDFEARVLQAWHSMRSAPKPVCIVAHEAVNSILWRELSGQAVASFRQAYCEILKY